MSKALSDLHTSILNKSSWRNRWLSISNFVQSLGADHIIAAAKFPDNTIKLESTMADEVTGFYLDQAFPQGDPRFEHCLNNVTPCNTGTEFSHNWNNPPAMQEFDRLMALHGARSATMLPVHSDAKGISGCICFLTDKSAEKHLKIVDQAFDSFSLAAHLGFNYWCKIPDDNKTEPTALTQREKECLVFLANGYRTDRIAERLGISNATIEFHLTNARKKLKTKTRTEAVASAIQHGFIAP